MATVVPREQRSSIRADVVLETGRAGGKEKKEKKNRSDGIAYLWLTLLLPLVSLSLDEALLVVVV